MGIGVCLLVSFFCFCDANEKQGEIHQLEYDKTSNEARINTEMNKYNVEQKDLPAWGRVVKDFDVKSLSGILSAVGVLANHNKGIQGVDQDQPGAGHEDDFHDENQAFN